MIDIKKEECCGCSACAQSCKLKCIEMLQDNEGFLYPVVNKEKCVNCGTCENVCPSINSKSVACDLKGYVALSNDDKIREESSSGGIFSLLAEYILKKDGIVIGAAFDRNLKVVHKVIREKKDLYKLRGSKYVQSDVKNTYKQAESYLKNNIKVLYSGTSCQIAGLRNYLNKDYEGLYTVDVLCHGVPTPKLLAQYFCEMEKKYNSKIDNVYFRDKKNGWVNYSVEIKFENGKIYRTIFNKDPYMRLFLNNICLRPSCYQCRYNKLERNSDITIGDCWGVEHTVPDFFDDKGTSVIITRTDKGNQLLNGIKADLKYSECDIDYILPPDSGGRKACEAHVNRKKFFELLNQKADFESLTRCLNITYKDRINRKIKSIFRINN